MARKQQNGGGEQPPGETTSPSVRRSSAGLRSALFDEIDRIRNNQSDSTKANAIARLAGEIVNTVRLEIDIQKHVSALPARKSSSDDDNKLPPSIEWTTPQN